MLQTDASAESGGDSNTGVTLAILHRNRLLRDCLAKVLADRRQVNVISVDHRCESQIDMLRQRRPDLVLVDINLTDNRGLDWIRRAQREPSPPKVIALAATCLPERFVECIELAVHSFVLEESSIDELDRAVSDVLKGEAFCSSQILQSVFSQMAQRARQPDWREQALVGELTAREHEIVQLIGEHLSNKQIAKRLCVSLYTVKNHVHNILEKLHVESRFGAVEQVRRGRHSLERSASLYSA